MGKFDGIKNAGAMAVSDWTVQQAESHLMGLLGAKDMAEELDMFSALYGMDRRRPSPGDLGQRSARLLDMAEQMDSWKKLQDKSEAKPWACALAAREVLAHLRARSADHHEISRADRKVAEQKRNLEQAHERMEQQREKERQQAEQKQGQKQESQESQQGEGDQQEGQDGQDGQQGDQGQGEGQQPGQCDAQDGQGDQPGQAQQGQPGGQQRANQGCQSWGTEAGQDTQADLSAAMSAAMTKAEKELSEAQANYDKATKARDTLAQGFEKTDLSQGIGAALKQVTNVDEALKAMDSAVMPGTEAAFGLPLDELAKEMGQNTELAKIMRHAGRMAMTGRSKARQRRGGGAVEVVDVTTGGLADICDAVPAELLGLVDPDLEILLDKSIAEESIQIELKRGRDPEERGPVVVCVDESGSMEGQNLVWAKSVALAMFLRCVEERRPFAVVRFDTRTEVVAFPKPRVAKWKDISNWLTGNLGGGTNIYAALVRADDFISKQPKFKKADVLLVTDGQSSSWVEKVQEMRTKGRSVYGVQIGYKWQDHEKDALEEAIELSPQQMTNEKGATEKISNALSV